MDPFLGILIVVWFIKVLAEDGYSTVTGRPNPRLARRAARQRSRSNNRIWGAFVNYLGDAAEDAREEATARRRAKLAERRRQREQADEPTETPAADEPPVDIPLDDPKEETEPTETPGATSPTPGANPLPHNVIPLFPAPTATNNTKENPMSTQVNGEVTGLDPAIAYAASLANFAGDHGQAGNEGYIGFLAESKVTGEALSSAHEMQAAFAAAQAAAEHHKEELEKQKGVQEAYNTNPDAGDKEFQQNGQ